MDLNIRTKEMIDFFDRKIDTYDEVHGVLMENKIAITTAPYTFLIPIGWFAG